MERDRVSATTKTTPELLAELVAGQEEYFKELFDRIDNDDPDEEARQEADEAGYGLSIERHVLLTLAGGGPSHWLDVTLDDDGDVQDVVSITSWAGPQIRTEIYPDSGLWRWAESYTSWIGRLEQ